MRRSFLILLAAALIASAPLYTQEADPAPVPDAQPVESSDTAAPPSLAKVNGMLGVGIEYNHTSTGDFLRPVSGLLDLYPNVSALQLSFTAGPLSGQFKWAAAFNDLYFGANVAEDGTRVIPDGLAVYGYLYDAWAAVTAGPVQVKLGAITFDQYASFAYTEGNKPKAYGMALTLKPLAGLEVAAFLPAAANVPGNILGDAAKEDRKYGDPVIETLARTVFAAQYALKDVADFRVGLNLKSMGDHAWSALPTHGPTVWFTTALRAVKDLALAADVNLVQLGTPEAAVTLGVSASYPIGPFTPSLFAAAGFTLSPIAPALLILTPTVHFTGLKPLDIALTGTYRVISWDVSLVVSIADIAPETIKVYAIYRSDATIAAGVNFVFMF